MSITGDPGDPDTIVHTTRSVGAVTRAVCKLKRGDMVGIRGPFGTPWPVEEAAGKDVIIVAGGIGLAPLRPVIYQILSDRAKYGKVALDLRHSHSRRHSLSKRACKVAIPTGFSRRSHRRSSPGRLARSGRRGHYPDPQSFFRSCNEVVAMVCGPEVMMRFTGARAGKPRGGKRTQVYISMERNMKCAVGFCGHCQFGPHSSAKTGPVFRYDRIAPLLGIREL